MAARITWHPAPEPNFTIVTSSKVVSQVATLAVLPEWQNRLVAALEQAVEKVYYGIHNQPESITRVACNRAYDQPEDLIEIELIQYGN